MCDSNRFTFVAFIYYHLLRCLVLHAHRPERHGAVLPTGDVAALRVVHDCRYLTADHVRDEDNADDGVAML